jgi:hypothetical protein
MVLNMVSQYVTIIGKQNILREWVTSILLYHGHFYNLVEANQMGRCNASLVCRLLGIISSELDDENKLYSKLIDLQKDVQGSEHDESDPFCVNTRWIQTAMGLGETELALLRFYLLATANGGLKETLFLHNEDFLELTLCEFLADFLRLPVDEVHSALAPDAPLKRSGLLRLPFSHGRCRNISDWIDVQPLLVERVFRSYDDAGQILNVIYSTSKPANLSLSAFEHLGPGFPVINDYVKAAVAEGKPGVNILLWGEPGTGKTELARALSGSCGVQALEVASLDADGDPPPETDRMAQYRLGQYMFGRSGGSIFIFDEVESILCDVNFAIFARTISSAKRRSIVFSRTSLCSHHLDRQYYPGCRSGLPAPFRF